jgi:hypothetical protein
MLLIRRDEIDELTQRAGAAIGRAERLERKHEEMRARIETLETRSLPRRHFAPWPENSAKPHMRPPLSERSRSSHKRCGLRYPAGARADWLAPGKPQRSRSDGRTVATCRIGTTSRWRARLPTGCTCDSLRGLRLGCYSFSCVRRYISTDEVNTEWPDKSSNEIRSFSSQGELVPEWERLHHLEAQMREHIYRQLH